MKTKYQLVLLGHGKDLWKEAFLEELRLRFTDFGLSTDEHLEVLDGAGTDPEWSWFPVAVWFGGPSSTDSEEVAMAKNLLDRGFSVFPVVEKIEGYKSNTPKILHPINGQEFNAIKLSNDVMSGFRLVRKFRQVFISYKRDESSGVANQLFHDLIDRGYRVFLDTVSVDAGVDFQSALWSRMADVDILVLIDSPNALSSRWVYEELQRANTLGMGVVQLIWPAHKKTEGTDFSAPIELAADDFVNGRADSVDSLTMNVLRDVVNTIESQRIRSLNSRRTRLVEGLLSNLDGRGITLFVHPARHVDVLKGSNKVAEIVPFVGVPDSFSVFEHERETGEGSKFIVYNGLGVDEKWAAHLLWLNEKANIEVFPIDDFGEYIGKFV